MLSVTFFYRAPSKTGLSIEGIFKLVKECLNNKIEIKDFFCDEKLSRLQNMKNAGKAANKINHITGDVNYLALAFKGKKNILTIHDFGHYENLKKRSWIRFIAYKAFWFQLPLMNIDIVTVVSAYTKGKLIEYLNFPVNKIRVIHNPVKPVFRYSPKEKQNETTRILQIGTGPHKNLKNLVAAVKDCPVHLDIIAHLNDNDIAMVKTANVSFTVYGALTETEVYERYKECDMLFFASLHEGFGMPIIEAQSVGRPVITSNYGAMKEVAKDSALLVDPNEPIQIKEAIFKLINDNKLYHKMVALGQENIRPYQHELIAQQYLDVYNELRQ